MTIFLLASPEVVAAFALGGIPGQAVNSRREALDAMEKIGQRQDLRLLVIEEAVAAIVREEIDRWKLDPRAPLVAEVPGFAGPAEGRPDVMGMIRHALGISL
jgi:vacuolar-type H+-ATPase subunit F/Vma7